MGLDGGGGDGRHSRRKLCAISLSCSVGLRYIGRCWLSAVVEMSSVEEGELVTGDVVWSGGGVCGLSSNGHCWGSGADED